MIVSFLKRAWPMLRLFGRRPVDRATFITAEDGTPIAAENGEAITNE